MTETIPDAPWVVPGARAVVLAGGWSGNDLSKVVTIERVGKLHVVVTGGDKYGARPGPGLLRRAAWKDSWSSAPRLVAADSEEAWRAWCGRRVDAAYVRVLNGNDAVRKAVQEGSGGPGKREAAGKAVAEARELLSKLGQVLELDPAERPRDWEGVPTH